jgi:hypothetical protein
MISALTLASLLLVAPLDSRVICVDPGSTVPDATLRELYEEGQSYPDFLDAAVRRAELWHGNTDKADAIDPALIERARAIEGTWRFLAVAIDSCSDSVSTIPYLGRLVALVDGLDMRIVDPTVGRSIMEGHRTPDGRASTPTVLLLDDEYDEVGCFIERPPQLQTWILENNETLSSNEIYEQKMEWYADDAGDKTVEAFVLMLEAAATGATICG